MNSAIYPGMRFSKPGTDNCITLLKSPRLAMVYMVVPRILMACEDKAVSIVMVKYARIAQIENTSIII